jgi:proton-translocating NADH-quinone oxidoreductase chain L
VSKDFCMYLLIVCLPLVGFLLACGFGRFFGSRGAPMLTTFCVALSACFSGFAFYEVGLCGSPCHISFVPWFHCELFDASWGFLFDSLTVVMLVVVTFVSTLVHVYSIAYMGEDPHLPRFMSYLSIFTFFMLMLVTANNFIQMFFGWEGVGLASYLLINFWYTRLQANKSAIKALLVNRVGDFGLALGVMSIFAVFKTVDFITVFASAGHLSNATFIFFNTEFHACTIICLLLFVGAVGKSAQLGLHTWLPDAMEGPTPVSALIHAATMVTAGVFMIARCSPLFEYAPKALLVVTCVGAMTSFFAATTGVVQNDLKRVIAYSTCSQLGYMVFACGLSQYAVGVFHLMNHAFFKALLFLSAGSVIHALADEQDMRKMGGVVKLIPFTYSMMMIGSLALIGFPFLTGFYSKDVILEVAYAKYTIGGNFAYWLGVTSALFTSYYSFRLLFLTFLGPVNAFKASLQHVHDAPLCMAVPLILLAFGSIFVGYTAKDMMIGLGTQFWGNALFTLPTHTILLESEYIPQSIKFIPIVFSVLGALFALNMNILGSSLSYTLKTSYVGRKLYIFLNKRWLFDKVYNDFVGEKALAFGYFTSFKALDKGFIELLGPAGLMVTCTHTMKQVSTLQSGYIYHYALLMLCGLTGFVAIFSFWDALSPWIDTRLYGVYVLSFIFYNETQK